MALLSLLLPSAAALLCSVSTPCRSAGPSRLSHARMSSPDEPATTLSWATERNGLQFTGIEYDSLGKPTRQTKKAKTQPVSSSSAQTGFGWATERARTNYGAQFHTAYEKDALGRRVARGIESDRVRQQVAADVDAAAEARLARKRRQMEAAADAQTESFREQSRWGSRRRAGQRALGDELGLERERPVYAYAQPMASVQPAPPAPAPAAQPVAAQPVAAQPVAAQPARPTPSSTPAAANPWVDKRARELAQDALEAYFADKIDEAELKRRKQAAHTQAGEELGLFALLEDANAAYASASSAREAAEQAHRAAVEAEDEAANQVEAMLRMIEEKGVSPPSAGN